jgi:hypothetical protein
LKNLDHHEFDGMLEFWPFQQGLAWFWESFRDRLHKKKQEAQELHAGLA